MSETRLLVTAHHRGFGRLDDALPEQDDPCIDALLACTSEADERLIWLCGGEPTLRADLPDLMGALAARFELGLITDGLALAKKSNIEALSHLSKARLALHCARPDAHDWLVDRAGAAKTVLRSLRTLRKAGVTTEVCATVTRPTLPYLAELAELCAHLGVSALVLRRLIERGRVEPIMLTPHLVEIAPVLEQTLATARRVGLQLRLEGFAECATGSASSCRQPEAECLVAAGFEAVSPPRPSLQCPACPGPPRCEGMPSDYVKRFGEREILTLGVRPATAAVVRVRFEAATNVACDHCGSGAASAEPTRVAKLRLVHAAQTGAKTLRVASLGSLLHPNAATLLRETTLLGFERVEVCSDASALRDWADADLYPLKSLGRLDAPVFGPNAAAHDAFTGRAGSYDAQQRGMEKWRRITGAPAQSYAVLHHPTSLEGFAASMADGSLDPRFRLCSSGGSLDDLARAANKLRDAARAAIAEVLPACLLDRAAVGPPRIGPGTAFGAALDPASPPDGSDRRAIFGSCVCGPELARRCPGIAAGWTLESKT